MKKTAAKKALLVLAFLLLATSGGKAYPVSLCEEIYNDWTNQNAAEYDSCVAGQSWADWFTQRCAYERYAKDRDAESWNYQCRAGADAF